MITLLTVRLAFQYRSGLPEVTHGLCSSYDEIMTSPTQPIKLHTG